MNQQQQQQRPAGPQAGNNVQQQQQQWRPPANQQPPFTQQRPPMVRTNMNTQVRPQQQQMRPPHPSPSPNDLQPRQPQQQHQTRPNGQMSPSPNNLQPRPIRQQMRPSQSPSPSPSQLPYNQNQPQFRPQQPIQQQYNPNQQQFRPNQQQFRPNQPMATQQPYPQPGMTTNINGPMNTYDQPPSPITTQHQQPQMNFQNRQGPSVPQFNHPPAAANLSQPVPNFNPQTPQVPQFNQQTPQVPQFNQQTPQVPQFSQQAAPNFSQPAVPPNFNNQQTPLVPQFGGSASTISASQSTSQLNNQFSNMNFGSSLSQPKAPPMTNLLANPPSVWEINHGQPGSWMSPDNSVSGSSTSNCNPKYKCCTLNSMPSTQALLEKSKLPLGLIINPYRHLEDGEEPIPIINPETIVRCRRCRTYINPWVQFVDQGTRWKCNLCFLSNEVPSFYDWDSNSQKQVDRLSRIELTHSIVEFVAPQEYMVRPPQPVVIMFLIDVSFPAIQSGMVATAARAILDSLDGIPNEDGRTKVAFMTVDSGIGFYCLNAASSEPQMYVVSDLDGEVYLPCPDDLLVPLSECRTVIESFLSKLGGLFKNTQSKTNVLGRSLHFAFKLINPIGGKIVVLQYSLPNADDGALKERDDKNIYGTPKETPFLNAATQFYKNLAVDCSRNQVSIDVFLFNGQYADVATLGGCAKYTGGSLYYYPGFNAALAEDALKFADELHHLLTRPIGLEAVLRVRATKGIRMTSYHGNFFLRSTDLLQLPNVSPDNCFVVEMTLDEDLSGSIACFQTALLHTSSNGERRIRVITLALPVSDGLSDLFASADPYAITTLLTKKAVDRALTSKIDDAREALFFKLVEIMGAFKVGFTTTGQALQVMMPDSLKLLPVMILGLLKSPAFRDTNTIPTDMRAYMLSLYYVSQVSTNIVNCHPRFYALHNLESYVGLPGGDDGKIVMPQIMNLSSEKLSRNGLYLIDNGIDLLIWVSKELAPEIIQAAFERPSYDQIPLGKYTFNSSSTNPLGIRFFNIIAKIRQTRIQTQTNAPFIYICKEDGPPVLRGMFLMNLIEDQHSQMGGKPGNIGGMSYPQFLQCLKEQIRTIK